MPKIAVDIVLLPPEEIMDQAISVNKTLQTEKQAIFLDKNNCLPHVTLAMGVMDSEKIQALAVQLVALADQFPRVKIIQEEISDSKRASGANFQKTPDLKALHEAIMNIVRSYFSYDATAEMFLTPPAIDEFPIYFIKHFIEAKSYAGYKPHLTFGLGKPNLPPPEFNFTASRLALCHLGIYCTCRKILFETTLSG